MCNEILEAGERFGTDSEIDYNFISNGKLNNAFCHFSKFLKSSTYATLGREKKRCRAELVREGKIHEMSRRSRLGNRRSRSRLKREVQ